MSQHFSLDMLERVAGSFVPPSGAFDPAGRWEHRYALYCLVHNNRKKPVYGNPAGSLVVRCEGRRLAVEYKKLVNRGLAHRISVETEIAKDALSTPASWKMVVEFAAADGESAPWPRMDYSMRSAGGRLEISEGSARRTVQRPANFTSAWALLDAVQRLPRKAGDAHRFAFFDRELALKMNHVLRYREAVDLQFGGRSVRLHGFEHLGDGWVPSMYWVDDAGRLMMFHHSLQGYILQPGGAP
jgi:hypothetical protein